MEVHLVHALALRKWPDIAPLRCFTALWDQPGTGQIHWAKRSPRHSLDTATNPILALAIIVAYPTELIKRLSQLESVDGALI